MQHTRVWNYNYGILLCSRPFLGRRRLLGRGVATLVSVVTAFLLASLVDGGALGDAIVVALPDNVGISRK